MDISIYLLWAVTLVLLVLTLILFLSSILLRIRNKKWNKQIESYKEKFYPIILEYLEEGGDEDALKIHFKGRSLEYYAFENIITQMLSQVEGKDAEHLQQLLLIDPIFNYHLKQLNSWNDVERVKACNYFSHVRLINFKVIKKLQKYLDNTNRLLAFSAATALMGSNDVEIRAGALKAIFKIDGISEMALLELLYKFHSQEDDQMEEESAELEKVLLDDDIPEENRALLILGAAEIGYYHMAGFLLQKMNIITSKWRNTKVLSALIRAQSELHNMSSLEVIRKYLKHHDAPVVVSAIEELAKVGGQEDLASFFQLLKHDDPGIKYASTKALLDNDVSEDEILSELNNTERQEIENYILRCKTALQ